MKRWLIPAAATARVQSNDLNREIRASNLLNCHKEVINAPPVPSISRWIHIVYLHKNIWEYQWSNFIYNCMSTCLHYVHCKDALLECSAPGGERCESLTWVDEIKYFGYEVLVLVLRLKYPYLYSYSHIFVSTHTRTRIHAKQSTRTRTRDLCTRPNPAFHCNVTINKVLAVWNMEKRIRFLENNNFFGKMTIPLVLQKPIHPYNWASVTKSWSAMLYNDKILPQDDRLLSDNICAKVMVYR